MSPDYARPRGEPGKRCSKCHDVWPWYFFTHERPHLSPVKNSSREDCDPRTCQDLSHRRPDCLGCSTTARHALSEAQLIWRWFRQSIDRHAEQDGKTRQEWEATYGTTIKAEYEKFTDSADPCNLLTGWCGHCKRPWSVTEKGPHVARPTIHRMDPDGDFCPDRYRVICEQANKAYGDEGEALYHKKQSCWAEYEKRRGERQQPEQLDLGLTA